MTLAQSPKLPRAKLEQAKRSRQRKAARRKSALMAKVLLWWAEHPPPRPGWVTPSVLESALGVPMPHLATVLRVVGWTRIQRYQRTMWFPPTKTPQHFPDLRRRVFPAHLA